MANGSLDDHIQEIKGIGPRRARLFEKIGITTIRDALYYLPFRYIDRTNVSPVAGLVPGNPETIRGRIISSSIKYFRDRSGRRQQLFELAVNDGTGILRAVWFNQSYLKKLFRIGQEILLSGTLQKDSHISGGPEMPHPEYEVITDDSDSFIHINRIAPVYGITEGITQKQFRKIMHGIVMRFAPLLSDALPEDLLKRNQLPGLSESILQAHFPSGKPDVALLNAKKSRYHKRLSFDDLFMLELGLVRLRAINSRTEGTSFVSEGRLRKKLLDTLPYRLTNAQQKALQEIVSDMQNPYPMQRLLQGDVGSGKTVVALLAILNAIECGYQAVLMVPTEVLAEQHFLTIRNLTEPLNIEIGLLTGSIKKRRLEMIESGDIDLVIGTHAVIQENVRFKRLAFVVIDEQHKFGVTQRVLLREKGLNPDVLVMTATPIPRSLALIVFGDLDCSVIDELPPNRKPVQTRIVDAKQKKEIYRILEEEINKRRQVYVVYPAIEESEESDLRYAIQGKEAFTRIFPQYTNGLLHGRMTSLDKEQVMDRFKKGAIDILISTTVIEVGLDVPNATVMIIIHAERFGLAQMHQLRGRIGRGGDSSYCLLVVYNPVSDDARRRLDIMAESTDGFRIAEEDLAIRGPGEFFGERQAGLPDMRVADMLRDIDVIEVARKEVISLIGGDPELLGAPLLRENLEIFWRGKIDLFKTG